MTIYQLFDAETEEELGLVRIVSKITEEAIEELQEAWHDFNCLEETDEDNCDVDAFVNWNNENYVTQIERVYMEFL